MTSPEFDDDDDAYRQRGAAQAAALQEQAYSGGLPFEAYLPPALALRSRSNAIQRKPMTKAPKTTAVPKGTAIDKPKPGRGTGSGPRNLRGTAVFLQWS